MNEKEKEKEKNWLILEVLMASVMIAPSIVLFLVPSVFVLKENKVQLVFVELVVLFIFAGLSGRYSYKLYMLMALDIMSLMKFMMKMLPLETIGLFVSFYPSLNVLRGNFPEWVLIPTFVFTILIVVLYVKMFRKWRK
jgi:hypothetical protein